MSGSAKTLIAVSPRCAESVPCPRRVSGLREHCLAFERQARPRKNIGWNIMRGGVAPEPRKHGWRPLRGTVTAFKDLWRD
jgi:hypothetical protein